MDAIRIHATLNSEILNLPELKPFLGKAVEIIVREESAPPPETAFNNWKAKFDAWMAEVEARAHRYPPGFVMNDSRDSIYEGCGE
jgi:hypothetical protein